MINKAVAIFSDNDPDVSLKDSKIFYKIISCGAELVSTVYEMIEYASSGWSVDPLKRIKFLIGNVIDATHRFVRDIVPNESVRQAA